MAQIDYKDKIRKLLALAESPSEHEAKMALLKARQLMAEHKLTERDLVEPQSTEIAKVYTDFSCSKRRNPWMVPLANVIGENYCCRALLKKYPRQQTRNIGFIGFAEDIEICVNVYRYAVECVLSEIEQIKQGSRSAGLSAAMISQQCDSFGYGFASGCKDAFRRQSEENPSEFALVLSIPKEVNNACSGYHRENFRAKAQERLSAQAYYEGKQQGSEFDPSLRLAEHST